MLSADVLLPCKLLLDEWKKKLELSRANGLLKEPTEHAQLEALLTGVAAASAEIATLTEEKETGSRESSREDVNAYDITLTSHSCLLVPCVAYGSASCPCTSS